jgi:hypothetical protein
MPQFCGQLWKFSLTAWSTQTERSCIVKPDTNTGVRRRLQGAQERDRKVARLMTMLAERSMESALGEALFGKPTIALSKLTDREE